MRYISLAIPDLKQQCKELNLDSGNCYPKRVTTHLMVLKKGFILRTGSCLTSILKDKAWAVPSFRLRATQQRFKVLSLCTKLYYLAKNKQNPTIIVFLVIVIWCEDANWAFIYCLLHTYAVLHKEVWSPNLCFQRGRFPSSHFPQSDCSKGDFPAVRLYINILLIHQRAISGIVHEFHIKRRDLFLLVYFTHLFEISIFWEPKRRPSAGDTYMNNSVQP